MVQSVKRTAADDRVKRQRLGRDAWLNTARQALIEEGTAGLEINKLATRLGVTRGGFYWFFKSREKLLDELLTYWANTSTQLFERVLHTCGGNGMREYHALADLWIDENDHSSNPLVKTDKTSLSFEPTTLRYVMRTVMTFTDGNTVVNDVVSGMCEKIPAKQSN